MNTTCNAIDGLRNTLGNDTNEKILIIHFELNVSISMECKITFNLRYF